MYREINSNYFTDIFLRECAFLKSLWGRGSSTSIPIEFSLLIFGFCYLPLQATDKNTVEVRKYTFRIKRESKLLCRTKVGQPLRFHYYWSHF